MPSRTTPVLLLTATIRPAGMTNLRLTDPAERQRQYLAAVCYWLSRPDAPRLVLAENSGADLSEFHRLPHHGRMELISTSAEPFSPALGKGYGEFRMIDEAVARSAHLRGATHFAKITGRLTVKNYDVIRRRLPAEYDMVADVHVLRQAPYGAIVNTRLVFFSTAFYRARAAGLYRTMNDARHYYAEHALYDLMGTAPADAALYTRLPAEPRWAGCSGSSCVPYDDLRSRLRHPIHRLRRLCNHWLDRPSLGQVRALSNRSAYIRSGTQ